MSPDQVQAWLQLGLGGTLLTALILGYRRLWVFGWYASELREDRDFWRSTALKSMGHTDRAIAVVEKKAEGA